MVRGKTRLVHRVACSSRRLERVPEQYAGKPPVYGVDIDRDLAVAQRFGVMSIPTVLILRHGSELKRLDGLIKEDELLAAFERATHCLLEASTTRPVCPRSFRRCPGSRLDFPLDWKL